MSVYFVCVTLTECFFLIHTPNENMSTAVSQDTIEI